MIYVLVGMMSKELQEFNSKLAPLGS